MSDGFLERRPHVIPCVVAAVLLVGALGKWPYGYYTLLRLVVCAAALFVTVFSYQQKHLWATWCFAVVAVLFNPVMVVHLSRQIWGPIDVVAAALFVVSAGAIAKRE